MLSLDGATRQEVNQSPLAFVETPIQANVEQALARKDAIIRVRNAQVTFHLGDIVRLIIQPSYVSVRHKTLDWTREPSSCLQKCAHQQ